MQCEVFQQKVKLLPKQHISFQSQRKRLNCFVVYFHLKTLVDKWFRINFTLEKKTKKKKQ